MEDDYFIADDMRRSLLRRGHSVVGPVPTASQALALVASSARLDGAVLDINLANDGPVFPVADALAARGVPFVFATGYDRRVIPARFAHVKSFEKPCDCGQIMRTLFG